MEKYIFLDFNGTVLDDVDICLELLNDILIKTEAKPINKEKYLEVFGFPVKDYYVRAGVDFTKKGFSELADYFIDEYTRRNVFECSIFPDFKDFISKARESGYKIVLCSASKLVLLIDQLKSFGIYELFDAVLGLEDHHAKSKIDVAKQFIQNNNIDVNNVTFIGDTDHDYEVGVACGAKSILVSRGHQSLSHLQKVTKDIYPDLLTALESINKNA